MAQGAGFRRGLLVAVVLLLSVAATPAVSMEPNSYLPPGGRPLCSSPTVLGTAGDDTLYGTARNDVIDGLGGNDIIYGGGSADLICGGDGNDMIFGGHGGDRVYGGAGRDKLIGGAGFDTLDGGSAVDTCRQGETYRSCERPTVSQLAASCPTAAEVERIGTDLTFSFESDPTSHLRACYASQGSADLTPLQKRVVNAIRIMQRIPFDSALPWTNLSLYDWFVSVIDGIRFRSDIDMSFCCEPAGVINLKTWQPGVLSVWQTDLWINPAWNAGLGDMMILLVHEARHNQGYGHTCGGGTQDHTIDELGSWGVQYYLYLWLADHASPVFMRAPIAGDPAYYQDEHRRDAQSLDPTYDRFCDEP